MLVGLLSQMGYDVTEPAMAASGSHRPNPIGPAAADMGRLAQRAMSSPGCPVQAPSMRV